MPERTLYFRSKNRLASADHAIAIVVLNDIEGGKKTIGYHYLIILGHRTTENWAGWSGSIEATHHTSPEVKIPDSSIISIFLTKAEVELEKRDEKYLKRLGIPFSYERFEFVPMEEKEMRNYWMGGRCEKQLDFVYRRVVNANKAKEHQNNFEKFLFELMKLPHLSIDDSDYTPLGE